MHLLPLATVLLTGITSLALANPVAAPIPAPNANASPLPLADNPTIPIEGYECGIAGHMVCGWQLINNKHWSYDTLRRQLCEGTGNCNMESGDVWNSLWQCLGKWKVSPVRVCGGEGSCVIDRFNWEYTCKGGSCQRWRGGKMGDDGRGGGGGYTLL
ncbi:hypothetical protein P154DRAFT_526922 [Amniculicola lignicola CBS 123094]|uniref:SRCR domain-containing protein n=1 Tax=Amniculicola lignicola CBS 123094 TaxID=1392246 RepID=A0A6A5W177_9PLEO|nr:hypothetical protein P154DRAFT_526922 [Amniculicola lignicola CBS 123094]